MLDQLINDVATRFHVPTASISSLIRGLLPMMTNEETGGAPGFVELFNRAGLGDVVTSWFGHNQAKAISPAQIESALGHGNMDRLAGSSGLGRPIVASILTSLLPTLINLLTPNGALPSNATLRSAVSSLLTRSGREAVEPLSRHSIVTPVEHRGRSNWLVAAALVAAIAIAGFFWMRAPAGTIDPSLTVSNQDGRISYSGVVHDESTRAAIESSLRSTFGAGNVSGTVRVDDDVRRAAWAPRLGDLFASLKPPGVEFALNGDEVKVGGWLSAAERQRLNEQLRRVFGSQVAIGSLGDAAADAARVANEKAISALGAIGTSGVSPDTLVETLNLAIINFPTGSTEIPSDSLEIIQRSAEAIKASGATIEISGHTDNVGAPAANQALSQARANAVKEALVSDGAPAALLSSRGYGDTRPRASNDTEQGRFQNRRIEYTVVR